MNIKATPSYRINLYSINTKKIYKIKFSLSSLTLYSSDNNIYGVYITGLSKDIKDNLNRTLRTVTYKNMYIFKSNIDDNVPIYVDSINNTSKLGVHIKSL
jgi:hypothetical protein